MKNLFLFLVGVSLFISGCGKVQESPSVASSGAQFRILNGTPATREQYPYVGIVIHSNGGTCTGSLLSSTKVLTAGHCIYDFNTRKRLSPNQISFSTRPSPEAQGVTIGVSTYRVHWAYSIEAPTNTVPDLAILNLKEPISLSEYGVLDIHPVSASSGSFEAAAVGYGHAFTGSSIVKRIGSVRYAATVGNFLRFERGLNNQIACPGDSGGPVIFNRKIIGVLHTGNGSGSQVCETTTRTHYTSIPDQVRWIENKEFQNPAYRTDVDGDGTLAFSDVLGVVIELRGKGARDLFVDKDGFPGQDIEYVDANGDGQVSLADALEVVIDIRNGGVRPVSTSPARFRANVTEQAVNQFNSGNTLFVDSAYRALASNLDIRFQFQNSANYYQNLHKRNERWIYSLNNGWHFITPDGRLYRWLNRVDAKGRAVGQLVGSFLPSHYQNPRLITQPY